MFWLRPFSFPDPNDYYAPTVLSFPEYLTITIGAEIEEKNGKKAFTSLLNKYGFSGNGPSIEQVIARNTDIDNVQFDSEAGAFFMRASNEMNYEKALKSLKCIEDVECLDRWLKNSRWILFKE